MENAARTGVKSLGDKGCLQLFMFQRKTERKKKGEEDKKPWELQDTAEVVKVDFSDWSWTKKTNHRCFISSSDQKQITII